MVQPLFLQNIIACIWDFDKTLIPGYMQEPLFEKYRVDPKKFWQEVGELPNYYKKDGMSLIASDTAYLNHILTYTREGTFEGLNNDTLRKLGEKITFYKGLPEFFNEVKNYVRTNPDYRQHEIQVEHYIVSTGLRQMILGSKKEEFARVNNFQKQGRVQSFGEANYTEGSQTTMWIKNAISEIADWIVKNKERALGDKIGKPPKHLD